MPVSNESASIDGIDDPVCKLHHKLQHDLSVGGRFNWSHHLDFCLFCRRKQSSVSEPSIVRQNSGWSECDWSCFFDFFYLWDGSVIWQGQIILLFRWSVLCSQNLVVRPQGQNSSEPLPVSSTCVQPDDDRTKKQKKTLVKYGKYGKKKKKRKSRLEKSAKCSHLFLWFSLLCYFIVRSLKSRART